MQLSLMCIEDLSQLPGAASADDSDKDKSSTASKKKKATMHETSHDLMKDAMLEKVILIAVAYFCIATEMRLLSKSEMEKKLQAVKLKCKDKDSYD